MDSMDKLKSLPPLPEKYDPMLLEVCIGQEDYQDRVDRNKASSVETSVPLFESHPTTHMLDALEQKGEPCRDAPSPLGECIRPKEAATAPVLDEISADIGLAEQQLPVLTTPAKGGRRRKIMSAQRHSARLAARPSVVPVSRRAQHRMEMLDLGGPVEPTGDEAIKFYLERYKGTPPPHVTAALAALTSAMLAGAEDGDEEG
jgi:hypothetical protein